MTTKNRTVFPQEAIQRTVADLCADVDYWKGRAMSAENALKLRQEQDIRDAGLWDSYSPILRLLGGTPATPETQSCN